MKTPMQEFIEWIQENCMDGMMEPKEILNKAFEKKEKEKQVIKNAHRDGFIDSRTSEQYFNETFKND